MDSPNLMKLLEVMSSLVPALDVLGTSHPNGDLVIPSEMMTIFRNIHQQRNAGRVRYLYCTPMAYPQGTDFINLADVAEPCYSHSVFDSAESLHKSLRKYDNCTTRTYFRYLREYLGDGPFLPRHPSRFVPGSLRAVSWEDVQIARRQEVLITHSTLITYRDGKPVVESTVKTGQPGQHCID